MAFSYTGGRSLYSRFTNSADTTHLTYGDELINDSIQVIQSLTNWSFLEKAVVVDTVDGQRGYEIPANIIDVVDDVYVDVSGTQYNPIHITDISQWKQILAAETGESDRPQYWYRQGSKILLDPIPASNGNDITVVGSKRTGILQNADYTTGTASIDNGSKAVTGSGTTFTAAMVGRFISFTSGDGLLYEIAGYTSATSITLVKPYQGSNVSGSNYKIGEYSVLPPEFQIAPIYRAAALYWTGQDDARADRFWRLYDGGNEIGLRDDYGGVIGRMYNLYGQKNQSPYTSPSELSWVNPNVPPDNISQSNFT